MATYLLKSKLPNAIEHIHEAMNKIFISGRLELRCQNEISILYDVSHNAQSVNLLAKYLETLKISGEIHAVFSALKDKDLLQLIGPLKNKVHRWYLASLDHQRAASPSHLMAIFEEAEILVEQCYTTPLIAFNAALARAKCGDLIVVYGSFLTVGQVYTNVS